MARNALSIRQLGEEACWLLVRQALGIPDAKMQSDFMADRVGLLLFTRQSLPERLCVTAAVRQMGGTTIYVGDDGGKWREEMNSFQNHLLPIFSYYLDCCYTYGYSVSETNLNNTTFPVINAGSPEAQPAHALADICCMFRAEKEINGVETCWIGCPNGTLNSIMECTAIFPFKLRIALPPEANPSELREIAARLNTPITFVNSPEEAIKGAKFVYAGRRGDACGKSPGWAITSKLFSHAGGGARLFLSASPLRAIPIEPEVLSSRASMLTRQAEYRMRIHKRILHWVFER